MGLNRITIEDQLFRYALHIAFNKFQIRRVNPIHLYEIFFQPLDIRNSSAGIPWEPRYMTRGDVMDDPAAQQAIRKFWHKIKDGETMPLDDCKVLYQAHHQIDTAKICRVVYVYPTTITLMEACFAQPLITGFLNSDTPIAYGFDIVKDGAVKLRTCLTKFKYFGCFKFKNFDKTASKQLIEIAFDLMLLNLDCTRYQGQGIPDTSKLYKAWHYLAEYFLNTPLQLDNGQRYKETAGIPSDSYFAKLVESFINWIIINYAFLNVYKKLPDDCFVFGDNSVVAENQQFSINDISEFIKNKTGMEIDLSKLMYTERVDDVEFLGFRIGDRCPSSSLNTKRE